MQPPINANDTRRDGGPQPPDPATPNNPPREAPGARPGRELKLPDDPANPPRTGRIEPPRDPAPSSPPPEHTPPTPDPAR